MNPILLDFPSEFTTKHLLLRAPKFGDGKAVNSAILASINELKQWLPFAQQAPTLEDTETNTREAIAKFILREDLRFLIFERFTGQFIGSTGLHRINWEVRSFEIGYWIDSRFSGKGFMTEAVQGLIYFAETELAAKRIEIRCDSNNGKSRNIPEKLGFTLEGTFHHDALSADGKSLRDTSVFAKIIQRK
ncbi:GNAT family N-acetyltransferase [Metabacillus bambusae]|uniref:GNAT family N-acetyltransferase n=1 Tax=Metabacillus bambusae TaxID=2795218 RepID=A0ABS3N9G5_9BACI|nr:GNAT family N-acetyltransferase [Metabacillus bambusae]MBO1514690.1 GNAT family N-acetyltransferase [Metabacillus bambusae]